MGFDAAPALGALFAAHRAAPRQGAGSAAAALERFARRAATVIVLVVTGPRAVRDAPTRISIR